MRKILVFIIAANILVGCDKREKYFEENSIPPTIGLVKNNEVFSKFSDSVKVIQSEQQFYPIEIKLSTQNSEINSLQFRVTKGKGHLEYRENKVVGNALPAEYATLIVKYIPETLGEHKITFIATNRFGVKSELNTTVLFFVNFPPKAALEIFELDVDGREYMLDATDSSSGDAKFGGYIKKYIFTINDQSYELNSPKMNYIFPKAGDYEVKLKVIDGDGVENETVKTVKVEK